MEKRTGIPAEAMAKKTLYRVSVEGELFKIELAGDSETEYALTKAQAIERAKVLARRAPIGGVVVIGSDGRIEQEIDVERSTPPSGS
jgi:hypothetical protein